MPHVHSRPLDLDKNAEDYSNPDRRSAFMMLPEADQILLKNLHQSQANILNGPETIEIAGYRILANPIETIGMTEDQKQKFKEAGGLIDPSIPDSAALENQNKMMYWETDYDDITGEIEEQKGGKAVVRTYSGFELFQKLFPEYAHLSEQEARSKGLMTRYDRNHWAREDFAKKMGGKQATEEELNVISEAARDRAVKKNPNAKNLEILREMGQKLLGGRGAAVGKHFVVGEWSYVVSGSVDAGGLVRGLSFHRDESHSRDDWSWQRLGHSSVIIMHPPST